MSPRCTRRYLGEIGGRKAHHLLHTHYQNRRRIADERMVFGDGPGEDKVKVSVCAGTSCFLKGSQEVISHVLQCVDAQHLQDHVEVSASFCFEKCEQGPTVRVDGEQIQKCTGQKACGAMRERLTAKLPSE